MDLKALIALLKWHYPYSYFTRFDEEIIIKSPDCNWLAKNPYVHDNVQPQSLESDQFSFSSPFEFSLLEISPHRTKARAPYCSSSWQKRFTNLSYLYSKLLYVVPYLMILSK